MSCLSLSGAPSASSISVWTPICHIGLPFFTAILFINQSINESINQSIIYYYTIRAYKDLKVIHFTSLTTVQYNKSL